MQTVLKTLTLTADASRLRPQGAIDRLDPTKPPYMAPCFWNPGWSSIRCQARSRCCVGIQKQASDAQAKVNRKPRTLEMLPATASTEPAMKRLRQTISSKAQATQYGRCGRPEQLHARVASAMLPSTIQIRMMQGR